MYGWEWGMSAISWGLHLCGEGRVGRWSTFAPYPIMREAKLAMMPRLAAGVDPVLELGVPDFARLSPGAGDLNESAFGRAPA